MGEAETRLRDGIQLGYFPSADCEAAFRFARRSATACVRLRKSQEAFMKRKNPRPSTPTASVDQSDPSEPAEPEDLST